MKYLTLLKKSGVKTIAIAKTIGIAESVLRYRLGQKTLDKEKEIEFLKAILKNCEPLVDTARSRLVALENK